MCSEFLSKRIDVGYIILKPFHESRFGLRLPDTVDNKARLTVRIECAKSERFCELCGNHWPYGRQPAAARHGVSLPSSQNCRLHRRLQDYVLLPLRSVVEV